VRAAVPSMAAESESEQRVAVGGIAVLRPAGGECSLLRPQTPAGFSNGRGAGHPSRTAVLCAFGFPRGVRAWMQRGPTRMDAVRPDSDGCSAARLGRMQCGPTRMVLRGLRQRRGKRELQRGERQAVAKPAITGRAPLAMPRGAAGNRPWPGPGISARHSRRRTGPAGGNRTGRR
jgi:hypothetical protein